MAIILLFYFNLKNQSQKKEIAQNLIQSELQNKKLKTKQLQIQLEHKKTDLTNLAIDISRKNDFTNTLNEKLNQLQKTPPAKIKSELREIISLTSNHLQVSEDLAILQKNIADINAGFNTKLDSKFGPLSFNEKHLCGLIRLGLSNKDIATIRNISVNSAKMNRYRLRKKLALSPKDDIVLFLQEI